MNKPKKLKYKRILIKLSGEAFQGSKLYGIDPKACIDIAAMIKQVSSKGIQVAVVLGGGNIFRGVEKSKGFQMDRAVADYMGMLATVINGLALQNALEKEKIHTRVQTAIQMHQVAEPYIRRRAIRHLEKGRVVIFVAGTGSPFFTTDTAAALRAVEIEADILMKVTKVDGVYTSDPFKDKGAVLYKKLKYIDVLQQGLKVMDSTAISMCMDNKLPILVFSLKKKGSLLKAIYGEKIGTLVS